jgi:hypothetical protein
MRRLHLFALVAMFSLVTVATTVAQNVILNPGFEADAVLDQEPVVGFATDWTQLFNNAASASAPLHPARTGIGSLILPGGGGFGVPGAYQQYPASPGDTWDLQGYMRTDVTLPADITFGVLKIVFTDEFGTDLEPAEVTIGQVAPAANPGAEALPLLNSTATLGEWHFSQARAVAPAGTAFVEFYALLVDQSAGTIYADDLQGMLIVDEGIPGDFDDDGDVDGRDFLDWQRGGSPTPLSATDLTAWQDNYGAGGGLVATQAVPEPSSVCLALLGVAAIFRRRMI